MASVPRQIFAIGDIHGCAAELRRLIAILPLTSDSTLVFLGDYVDRGPASREVIETILALKEEYEVVTLTGNHEAMLTDFLADPCSSRAGTFFYNGGGATLASYSTGDGDYDIPTDHIEFFESLRLVYQTDDYFFVHAGVPNVPLEDLDPEPNRSYLLWTRKPFLESSYNWSKLIIHGHTPHPQIEVRPNRINLDTGCVLGNRLSAIELPARRVHAVTSDRKPGRTYLISPDPRRRAVRFPGAIPVLIRSGEVSVELETLNHNEFGMFCRDASGAELPVVRRGESLHGIIGPDSEAPVEFEGQVIRCHLEEDGIYYAIKINALVEEEEEAPAVTEGASEP